MVVVYILQSHKDHGYYIGITKNIDLRIKKHNAGQVFSTKSRKPWKIVLTEEFINYKEAREREIELKSYKGGIQFKELIKHCRVV